MVVVCHTCYKSRAFVQGWLHAACNVTCLQAKPLAILHAYMRTLKSDILLVKFLMEIAPTTHDTFRFHFLNSTLSFP